MIEIKVDLSALNDRQQDAVIREAKCFWFFQFAKLIFKRGNSELTSIQTSNKIAFVG